MGLVVVAGSAMVKLEAQVRWKTVSTVHCLQARRAIMRAVDGCEAVQSCVSNGWDVGFSSPGRRSLCAKVQGSSGTVWPYQVRCL